jgi:hypothetical protein
MRRAWAAASSRHIRGTRQSKIAAEAIFSREFGGRAGNRTRKNGHEPAQKQANTRERGGQGDPSDSRQFVQVDARYAAHHSQLELAARAYLETGATGKSCAHLALQLAAAVMSSPLVQEAMAVLAGGEHVHSRATELASHILAPSVSAGAAAPTPSGSGATSAAARRAS